MWTIYWYSCISPSQSTQVDGLVSLPLSPPPPAAKEKVKDRLNLPTYALFIVPNHPSRWKVCRLSPSQHFLKQQPKIVLDLYFIICFWLLQEQGSFVFEDYGCPNNVCHWKMFIWWINTSFISAVLCIRWREWIHLVYVPIFNGPGVAGIVLQTPSWFIN